LAVYERQANMKVFSDPVLETELALIHIDHKPAFYARVEKITEDVKPKWWRVKFLFLTVPLQVATWIIDDDQIRGADFTMGGTPIRIERVVVPEDESSEIEEESARKKHKGGAGKKTARVLSLGNAQKNAEE
jgi:hypothetical protein